MNQVEPIVDPELREDVESSLLYVSDKFDEITNKILSITDPKIRVLHLGYLDNAIYPDEHTDYNNAFVNLNIVNYIEKEVGQLLDFIDKSEYKARFSIYVLILMDYFVTEHFKNILPAEFID